MATGRRRSHWLITAGLTSGLLAAALAGGSWGVAYGQTVPPAPTATHVPTATATVPPTATAVATATATAAPSGGGGAPPASPASSPAVGPPGTVSAAGLNGTTPTNVSASFSATAGGTVIAGNVGLSIPAGDFPGGGNVTVTITANPPSIGALNAGGPAQFSPNGTILSVTFTDSSGAPITSFAHPITLVFKPNAADLAMAHGNFPLLTIAYAIDSLSPPAENPNGFPLNTLVLVPPSSIVVDQATGVLTANLNFIGSVLGVVTNPVGWYQTLNPSTNLYSGFDPSSSQVFGTLPQWSYVMATEPQVGTRLYVINPLTHNYAYVNATDVGPSGPPPASSS